MALTLDDMNKIAHLARVGLSDDEKNRYTESLNNILGLINELQAVNTSGIEPLAHALEVTQPLRADVVTERNQRDAYQAIAPAVQDGLYLGNCSVRCSSSCILAVVSPTLSQRRGRNALNVSVIKVKHVTYLYPCRSS